MANQGEFITAAEFLNLKAALQTEVQRRSNSRSVGSMATYAGSAYQYTEPPNKDTVEFKSEHIEKITRPLDAYRQRLSGDLPVMHRMWELWTYLAAGFDGAEPYLKRMRKAKNLSEYQAAVDALLREQPLVYSKEG